MFVVIEKYFNSGKVSAQISQCKEDIEKAIETQGKCIEHRTYDEYFTLYNTLEEAQQGQKDVYNA